MARPREGFRLRGGPGSWNPPSQVYCWNSASIRRDRFYLDSGRQPAAATQWRRPISDTSIQLIMPQVDYIG